MEIYNYKDSNRTLSTGIAITYIVVGVASIVCTLTIYVAGFLYAVDYLKNYFK